MRSTLFFVPHQLAGWPLFGFGLILLLLCLSFAAWSAWQFWRKRPASEALGSLPFWLLSAAIVVFVLPAVEQRWPDGTAIGLPIRGYGVMVLLGLMCGIGLSAWRGQQLGLSADVIVGLGFWMMLGGVLGARLFYVVQKWNEDFAQQESLIQQLVAIVKLTEGGLVIYGGVIGGLLAGGWYGYKHRLDWLSTADLVAPGFLIGLALGRIGCLLHGCCFGGVCTSDLPTIRFPQGSGPYQFQIADGELLGLKLDATSLPARVSQVTPASLADNSGIQVGDRVLAIELMQGPPERELPTAPPPLIVEVVSERDGALQKSSFLPDQLPSASLPVHPSQIYAAINALLLCVLVWLLQPLPNRDGLTFLMAVLMYAVSRYLLEGVRSDEPGQLGSRFSIAQLVSMALGGSAFLGILWIMRLPPGRKWNWRAV